MFKVLIIVFNILFFSLVSAKAKDLTAIDHLKLMTKEYSNSTFLHAKFKQKQIMELLGDTKSAKGELYYSSQKLRLELNGEQNSVTLFTPGVITSISYDKKKKPTQVIKSKPYPHPLLNLMFGDEKTWDDFKVTRTEVDNQTRLEVEVVPKDPKKLPGIDRIELTVNKKKNQIVKIVYWDEIGNQTINEFSSQRFKDKVDGTKFILIPPAGVEVRNL